jgi:hypothetical protein
MEPTTQRSGASRSAAVEGLFELCDVELHLYLHLGDYATSLRLVWIVDHVDNTVGTIWHFLYAGTFFHPALSYIRNPGGNIKFNGAWALTFRFTLLF